QAQQFQETLGLFVDAAGYFPHVQGTDTKWLRGQPNQFGQTWYFLRSDGEFVAWNGKTDAPGRKVARGAELYQFDPQGFLNPQPLLYPSGAAHFVVAARRAGGYHHGQQPGQGRTAMKSNSRTTLVVPILIIIVGVGWLLTAQGVAPGINWVWTLAL